MIYFAYTKLVKGDKVSGIITGNILVTGMTKGLESRDYAISKVYAWIDLLNKNMSPTKFHTPTAKGTKIDFKQILNQGDYDKGIKRLHLFMEKVNEKHGTDFNFSN